MILPTSARAFLGADALSFSEIGTLARCEKAWEFSYRGEREETPASKAMALGSEIHRLIGTYHMTGVLDATDDELAAWLLARYAERYESDKTTYIGVEWPLVAKLPGYKAPYFFGYADGLFVEQREMWVDETKSTATLTNADYLVEQLQTPLYVWALRQMGYPVVGARLDVIRTHKPVKKELPLDESFDRRWRKWSDEELEAPLAEVAAAVQIRRDLEAGFRAPLRNVGSACSWCSHQAPCYGLGVTVLPEEVAAF